MRSQSRKSIALFLFSTAIVGLAHVGAAQVKPARNPFENVPDGWKVERTVTVPDAQLAALSKKLGGQVTRITNTYLIADGQQLQVNVVACQSDADAAKVFDAILATQKGNTDRVLRDGKSVVEFPRADLRLVRRAHYELGFKPRSVVYRVSFQAAPIEDGDPMAWNQLFNAFLAGDAGTGRVRELSPKFRFGDQVLVRSFGQGNEPAKFTFTPAPKDTSPVAGGESTRITFADLPQRAGVPQISVEAQIVSQAFAFTPTKRTGGPELVGPNAFWPSDAPDMVALAKQITAGKQTRDDQVAALLEWFLPGQNIRFGGPVTGSRYGVKKVLEQKFGHCWDFSDSFITLARASGIPCRQVAGWLHGREGHIWAEVLIEGKGWRAVDPTAGMGCGSDYVPLFAIEDGRMPVVYTSAVKTEVILP
jgi:transglutaminase-like putative cysteine protease